MAKRARKAEAIEAVPSSVSTERRTSLPPPPPVGQEEEVAAVWVDLRDLKPWEDNPRDNDAAVDDVIASIRMFGWADPIIARRADGEIIAGHTRYKAAVKMGMKRAPVRFMDLDPAKAHLLAIADNKLNEIATWVDRDLARVLKKLRDEDGLDVKVAGFEENELAKLLANLADVPPIGEDPGPDALPETADSVAGQLYELGPHLLLCGDATIVADVQKVMRGGTAHLVFTDPPYNVAYEGKTADALTIENDKMPNEAFRQFLRSAFASARTVTQPGGSIYICHADSEGENFRGAMREAGWLVKQCCIWVKDVFVMGRQDYHWQHEPILYGWAPGAAHRWFTDRKQTTVWNFARPKRNTEHPTMKPVELVEYAITNSTAREDVVLDPFGGSGSTLIAAARLGRAARLIELDPRYCDVIRRRWTKFAATANIDPGKGALE